MFGNLLYAAHRMRRALIIATPTAGAVALAFLLTQLYRH